MKALILAAGRGSRLKEYSSDMNKCMLPFCGKPIIKHSLDRLSEIPEISEVIIVVGYRAEDIINMLGTNYKGKTIRYALQTEQRGLVNAIECGSKFIGAEDFFLILGDEVMHEPKYNFFIEQFFKRKTPIAIIGVSLVENTENIKKTYTFLHDRDQRVYRLIEKPQRPLNNFIGTGHVIFSSRILNYIDKTPVNSLRNEKELPDLIQVAIDYGEFVYYDPISENYVNVNGLDDLLVLDSTFQLKLDPNTIKNMGESKKHLSSKTTNIAAEPSLHILENEEIGFPK